VTPDKEIYLSKKPDVVSLGFSSFKRFLLNGACMNIYGLMNIYDTPRYACMLERRYNVCIVIHRYVYAYWPENGNTSAFCDNAQD